MSKLSTISNRGWSSRGRPEPALIYLERQYVVAVVSPEGALLHPGLWGEGTGSREFGGCYNVAGIGLFHR